jgi:hypothetical protein
MEFESKANANGWYFKVLSSAEICSACRRVSINKGYVLMPGQNYAICLTCAEKEFK